MGMEVSTVMKLKNKKRIGVFVSLVLILQLLIYSFPKYAFGTDTYDITLTMSASTAEAITGDVFSYTILYSYPGVAKPNLENIKITDNAPSGIKFLSAEGSTDVESISQDGDNVTFNLKPLVCGTTGVLKITAYFPTGTTVSGLSPTNTASVTGDNVNPSSSNIVTVTSKLNTPNWLVSKTKAIPSGDPVPDSPVQYNVTLRGNSGNGQLNIHDAIMVDTLPDGAVYDSLDGGTYDPDLDTISWTVGNVDVGHTVTHHVTVHYPSSSFSTTSTVTNKLIGNVQLLGSNTVLTKEVSLVHGFDDPNPSMGAIQKTSRQTNDEYSSGQTAKFHIGSISNNGNVPLDKFILEDTIPSGVNITSITTGVFNMDVPVKVSYKTDPASPWIDWNGNPYSSISSNTLNVSDLTLGAAQITNIQWDFGDDVPAGFNSNTSIDVSGIFTGAVGTTAKNTIVLNSEYLGTPEAPKTAWVTITIVDPKPWLDPIKSVIGPTGVQPDNTVTYNLRIKNHDYATHDYVNPVAMDLLDDNLTFVDGSVTSDAGNSGIAAVPTLAKSINNGHTLLTWTWPDGTTLKPGEYVNVQFKATINHGILAGTVIDNPLYITIKDSENFKTATPVIDSNDLDGDISLVDQLASSYADIFVKFTGSIVSAKWVKGELDSGWHKYTDGDPSPGNTLPGGIADYKLVITNNNSNGPIRNIKIIDILPYKGDTGVIDNITNRLSEWRPNLVNNITGWDEILDKESPLPAGVKVFYSTKNNPVIGELSDPVGGAKDSSWIENAALPANFDFTSVRSIKIDCTGYNLGNGLDPDQSIVIHWPMRAPVGAPTNAIAWNSFGFGATFPDEGATPSAPSIQRPFLRSEPVKVGFKVQPNPTAPATYNIGDYVWEDMDKDGLEDDGYKGINGVLVNLYKDGAAAPAAFTRTGNDHSGHPGYYNFPDLESGHDYQVEFVYPKDYYITAPGNESVINEGDMVDYVVRAATINSLNSNISNIDAGLYKKASIGDYVWKDSNGDGIQDSTEQGINDVTVTLYNSNTDAVVQTTKTVNNPVGSKPGYYKFDSLDPGDYYVTVTLLNADYTFSTDDSGNPKQKSVVDSSGKSGMIPLRSGDNIITIDAGMHLAAIGDYLWKDSNANGEQDGVEPGINGATVTLCDIGGTSLGITATTKNGPGGKAGYFLLTDLSPGNYRVKFAMPTGYDNFSLQNTTSDIIDSNPDSAGLSGLIALSAGLLDVTVDAGVYKSCTLGNYVWEDTNGSGTQDAGENGISGVTVNLYKDGSLSGSKTTDVSGLYQFTGLVPGNYTVEFIKPSGYELTTALQGGDASKDSNPGSDGRSDIILASGDNIDTIDAGLYKPASISNMVWEDLNYNGLQDPGEMGLTAITINLYKSGIMAASTATGADGSYCFTNLMPGNYTAEFVKPAQYECTLPNQGADPLKDSNAASDGMTSNIVLVSGQSDTSIDAGLFVRCTLGDYVWEDTNGSGVQDGIEKGMGGVTVNLYNSLGANIATAVTAADGSYLFTNLVPGSYTVELINPVGYEFTSVNTGADLLKDSDADAGGKTAAITLVSKENNLSIDAGLYRRCSIGDFVWKDSNSNGIQDAGETGFGGITVNLYDHSGVKQSTVVTGADGLYKFDNLIPGDYTVEFIKTGGYYFITAYMGTDIQKDSNAGPSGKTGVSLSSGENNVSIDAGLYIPPDGPPIIPGSIGNFLWEDSNMDGFQDAGEKGIGGVTVSLYNAFGAKLNSTVTDSDGYYSFTDLFPGNYKVVFTAPNGFIFTKTTAGGDAAKDSNTSSDGSTSAIELTSGIINNTIDAGLFRYAEIGNLVWEDTNKNGIQDDGEMGLSNITVNLYDFNNKKIAAVLTSSDGRYSFKNLVAGSYKVQFIKPEGYDITALNNGSDNTKDSNAGADGFTASIALISGQADNTIDAGLTKQDNINQDTDSNEVLPKTGNDYYNYLLLGLLANILSIITIIATRIRKRKPKH